MKRITAFILAVVVSLSVMSGCSTKVKNNNTPTDTTKPTATANPGQSQAQEKWKAVLYFSDKEALHIIRDEKEIISDKKPDATEKARISIEELIKGSQNKDLTTSIPPATKLRSVVIDKNTAVVDLSKEFVTDNVGGSAGETMAIAPIVLTLTAIDGIKQVSFKIEGKVQSDFKGHFSLDKPFKGSDFEQYLLK